MSPRQQLVRLGMVVLAAAAAVTAAWSLLHDAARATHRANGAAATAQSSRRWVTLGHSVRNRLIRALELRDAGARRTALVVGCIHGDETAGMQVVRRLEHAAAPPGLDLWIVPDLNPDGVVARTRQNARRVDLNRNFPWRWQPLGRPGDQQYSGRRPLSEPESRIARRLIVKLRPSVTVWFHQPLALTDLSGGDPAVERRFARASGLPARRLPRYPGSATSWQNHRRPASTAFVVELPAGRPSPTTIRRYARALDLTLKRAASG